MLVCIPLLLYTVYFVLTFRPELLVVDAGHSGGSNLSLSPSHHPPL